MRRLLGWLVVAMLGPVGAVQAGDYSLFNPVPEAQMREFSSERPSQSDSPYTLDAGHFQLESSLYSYRADKQCGGGDCTKLHANGFAQDTTLRVGLSENSELQAVGDLYAIQRESDSSLPRRESSRGYGDTQLRLKRNLIGNKPSDDFSLAVLGYVKLPTAMDNLGNDSVEGGVELPFNVDLGGGWKLGGQTALLSVDQEDGTGHVLAFNNNLLLGKEITENLDSYLELYSYKAAEGAARWKTALDAGLAYGLSDNWSVDASVYYGLSEAADDLTVVTGTAYRF